VKEVARAFTGWTVRNATRTGFYFDPDNHDDGEKVVLGHTLPAGRGIEDGLHVLEILARHPSTAHFVCRKLCVRFVADQPPQSLIDSAAAVWTETDGDIRTVVRHILMSSEFYASAGHKLRRPLDFFVGAIRATGAQFDSYYPMDEMLNELAQVPYGWRPPNGYPDVAPAWIGSGSLLARWNVAMSLTVFAGGENWTGASVNLRERIGTPATVSDLVDEVGVQVFAAPPTEPSRSTFIDFASDGQGGAVPITNHLLAQKLSTLYGLMLASPIYQWR
jgi:uncharacterized protein (DUF1800 family)